MTTRSPYNLRLAMQNFKSNKEEDIRTEDRTISSNLESSVAENSAPTLYPSLAAQQISETMAATKLTFLQGSEIIKFKGNRTSKDGIFSQGPRIQDFLESIEAYFHRHEITDDKDRIVTIKLHVDQSSGDARFVLRNILDPNLNSKRVSYDELKNLLLEHYRNRESASLYDAAVHLQEAINNKLDTDQMALIGISNAIQNFVEAYTGRSQFADNKKTTLNVVKEAFLFFGVAVWGGRSLTEKSLLKFPSNMEPRNQIMEINQHLKKMTAVAAREEIAASVAQNMASKGPMAYGQTPKLPAWGQERPHREKSSEQAKSLGNNCLRCGLKNHRFKQCRVNSENIYCTRCQSRNHVATMCNFQSFRSSGNNFRNKPKRFNN